MLLTVLVIVVRVLYVAPLAASIQRNDQRATAQSDRLVEHQQRIDSLDEQGRISPKRKAQFDRRMTRLASDIRARARDGMGLRAGAVIGWAGMRGAITVAAAQTLAEDTVHRPQLVLIAYVVALGTLLIIGTSLPAVIRVLKVPPDDPAELQQEYAALLTTLAQTADVEVDRIVREEQPDPAVVERIRNDSLIRRRSDSAQGDQGSQPAQAPAGSVTDLRAEYVRIRLEILGAMRRAVLEERDLGRYSTPAINTAQRMLDIEETRLTAFGE